MNLRGIFRITNQWFSNTPERALDRAYKAALRIKAIEDEHFNGEKISASSADYSNSVISYFEADLKKYLKTVRVRLAEFRASRSVFNIPQSQMLNPLDGRITTDLDGYNLLDLNESQSITIEKLNFVDEILNKYSDNKRKSELSSALITLPEKNLIKTNLNQQITANNSKSLRERSNSWQQETASQNDPLETVADKTGVVPRSIIRTVNRLQQELDPKAEEEVVKKFRNSRDKTLISIKFILTLIIVPILTQQVTKNFAVGPIVDHFKLPQEPTIFLNLDLEEEAFVELHRFEEELRFKSLLGVAPKLSQEDIEGQVREKANEIAEEYRNRSADAIKNVFSDILSLLAFALVLLRSKADVVVLKSFIDDIVYGLSDSAKAFIIILFTDMFVGFHSPHGWEVILESISKHLGIPENRNFIFLFIATFPVILDSVIKYWIFRYLNRISPSAVATYRNMNE
ncbi:MAG TPA: proton extrusion protein PcxA [Cyanobacteria bacterium UBA8803]|nr:proton extrusion protein PcxA [Cyanobacteria bacterium UBA9273]HBL57230.1 proton extrusion protein PcxA [Cyanobacteria bacterium UBA8803]